jgi:trans-aconitate methyltransferase
MHETDKKWDGEGYRANSTLQTEAGLALLNTHTFNGEERILDLGSGDGHLTSHIADELTKNTIIGVDRDPRMVKFATETHCSSRPNLSFRQCDVSQLEKLTLDTQFDLVVSFNCLHWVSDQTSVLRHLRERLADEGQVLFGMPAFVHGTGTSVFIETVQEISRKDEWVGALREFNPPWHFFEAKHYEGFLLEAEFQPHRVQIRTIPSTLPSRASLVAWFEQILPQLDKLPDESQRQAFLQDITESYLKRVPLTEDGRASLSQAQLEVSARKLGSQPIYGRGAERTRGGQET